MISFKEKFGLQWDNDTESAPYLHSLQKARSVHVGYPTDMQCMDFTICKLGRVIRREEINKGNGTYLNISERNHDPSKSTLQLDDGPGQ